MDGRDPPDHLGAPQRQEVLGGGVLEEGILGAVEEGGHLHSQRRDPLRVPRVHPVGQVDELLQVAGGTDPADGDVGQMTPNSLPILANDSSAWSICACVWVAMRLVRSRHCDGGTAGATTGLVNTPAS